MQRTDCVQCGCGFAPTGCRRPKPRRPAGFRL